MTITLRQKDLENDNKSLYLDIYENGKRKFEFLSLYLIPEINQETKERNEATLKRAQEIRAERVLHPETIPEKGHLMVVPDIPNDDSPEVIDWIQTYIFAFECLLFSRRFLVSFQQAFAKCCPYLLCFLP